MRNQYGMRRGKKKPFLRDKCERKKLEERKQEIREPAIMVGKWEREGHLLTADEFCKDGIVLGKILGQFLKNGYR